MTMQGEFALIRKLNYIPSLQINMKKCSSMRYKGSLNDPSSEGNYLEPLGDSCPARSSHGRAALPETDARASLPGFFAQDQRDALVYRGLARCYLLPPPFTAPGIPNPPIITGAWKIIWIPSFRFTRRGSKGGMGSGGPTSRRSLPLTWNAVTCTRDLPG